MNSKQLLFIALLFVSTLCTAIAQEMCFKNGSLKMEYTVTFFLEGNKVTEGEFSSWNYDAATSGETTSFTGTKTGNTLTIKFSNKAPYALPPNTKQIVWTLKKNQLIIPTYGKDYTINKYTTYQAEYDLCASVKSDDYEENTKPKVVEKKCACQAFITDPDKGGLNVREKSDKNAAIVAKIPYSEEGTIVSIIGSAGNGWVKANKAIDVEGKKTLSKTGWIAGNKIGVATRGYDGTPAKIYNAPNLNSGVCGSLPPETTVLIIDCEGSWMKVKYKDSIGWLSPDDQCPNPVTNCN